MSPVTELTSTLGRRVETERDGKLRNVVWKKRENDLLHQAHVVDQDPRAFALIPA